MPVRVRAIARNGWNREINRALLALLVIASLTTCDRSEWSIWVDNDSGMPIIARVQYDDIVVDRRIEPGKPSFVFFGGGGPPAGLELHFLTLPSCRRIWSIASWLDRPADVQVIDPETVMLWIDDNPQSVPHVLATEDRACAGVSA